MAKGFRLSKKNFSGPSHNKRCLAKPNKGKGIRSHKMEYSMDRQLLSLEEERELALDDMGSEDFWDDSNLWGNVSAADLVWPSRLTRAMAAAEKKIREIFDPDYGSWEEVNGEIYHEDSEAMVSESEPVGGSSLGETLKAVSECPIPDPRMNQPMHPCSMEVKCNFRAGNMESSDRSEGIGGEAKSLWVCNDRKCFEQVCGDSFASTNFHVGESSLSSVAMEICETDEINCLGEMSIGPAIPSGYDSTEAKAFSRSSQSYGKIERSRGVDRRLVPDGGMKARQRTKKVIMGRESLLVSRQLFQDKNKKFRFFHTSSLSNVEVRVLGSALAVYHLREADGQLSQKDCGEVLDNEGPLIGGTNFSSLSQMEVVDEAPYSPISCVTDSLPLDGQQMSVEESVENRDSSYDRVGEDDQDSASGPQNLRAKRIVICRRHRLEECDSTLMRYPSKHKRSKIDDAKGSKGSTKTLSHPCQRKRKREIVIEDDPHSYRVPQRRVSL